MENSARSAVCEAVLKGRVDQQIDISLMKTGDGMARTELGETEMASMAAFPVEERNEMQTFILEMMLHVEEEEEGSGSDEADEDAGQLYLRR